MRDSPRGILNCVCLESQIDACHHCLSNTFKRNNKSSGSPVYFPFYPNVTIGGETSRGSGNITNSESTDLVGIEFYYILHV